MDTVVKIDPTVLSLIVGFILPMLTALVTKRVASGGVKAIVLLLLSIVAGFFTELQQHDGTFLLWPTVVNILVTFATAVISHFGLLQPVGVTGANGVIQRAVPGGVGSEKRAA